MTCLRHFEWAAFTLKASCRDAAQDATQDVKCHCALEGLWHNETASKPMYQDTPMGLHDVCSATHPVCFGGSPPRLEAVSESPPAEQVTTGAPCGRHPSAAAGSAAQAAAGGTRRAGAGAGADPLNSHFRRGCLCGHVNMD